MGAYLTLSISESNISKKNNTSKVTAKLYVHSSSGSWNGSSRSGSITIDGTKYSFSSSFKSNTTTHLATKSKTVKHDANGGGTITVKGYYSTGVSAGNISTSKSYKLDKISRTYAVKYDGNGGSEPGSNQTKTYGVTLTLLTFVPKREGYEFTSWNTAVDGTGTSYQPGASYTANAAVTLYAQWRESSDLYMFLGRQNIVQAIGLLSAKYTREYFAPRPTMLSDGYNFVHWKSTVSGYTYPVGERIKAPNELLGQQIFDPIVEAKKHHIHFYKDGVEVFSLARDYSFDEKYFLPELPDIPSTKVHVGWKLKGTLVTKFLDQEQTWTETAATGTSYIFNAVIEDKSLTYLDYNCLNGDKTSFSRIIQTYTVDGLPHIIDDYASSMPNVGGYKFSGWYKVGSPLVNSNWKNEDLDSQYVFPFNFDPVNDGSNYNAEYDIVTTGYELTTTSLNTTLYPVYKDSIIKSSIQKLYSTFEYVSEEPGKETTVQSYYSYLVGQTNILYRVIYSHRFVAAYVLTVENKEVDLDLSDIHGYLAKVGGTIEGGSETLFEEYSKEDFYVVKTGGTTETPTTTYYILIQNKKPLDDINYKKDIYRLYILDLKDTNGKPVDDTSIIISPPDIIRDINARGTAVAYFGSAPEPAQQKFDKEFHIFGDLYVNGLHVGEDEEGGGEIKIDDIWANKSVTASSLSFGKFKSEVDYAGIYSVNIYNCWRIFENLTDAEYHEHWAQFEALFFVEFDNPERPEEPIKRFSLDYFLGWLAEKLGDQKPVVESAAQTADNLDSLNKSLFGYDTETPSGTVHTDGRFDTVNKNFYGYEQDVGGEPVHVDGIYDYLSDIYEKLPKILNEIYVNAQLLNELRTWADLDGNDWSWNEFTTDDQAYDWLEDGPTR